MRLQCRAGLNKYGRCNAECGVALPTRFCRSITYIAQVSYLK